MYRALVSPLVRLPVPALDAHRGDLGAEVYATYSAHGAHTTCGVRRGYLAAAPPTMEYRTLALELATNT